MSILRDFCLPNIIARTLFFFFATGIVSYIYSGSLYSAFLYAVSSAVLLQIGFFGGVLFLVWQKKRQQKGD